MWKFLCCSWNSFSIKAPVFQWPMWIFNTLLLYKFNNSKGYQHLSFVSLFINRDRQNQKKLNTIIYENPNLKHKELINVILDHVCINMYIYIFTAYLFMFILTLSSAICLARHVCSTSPRWLRHTAIEFEKSKSVKHWDKRFTDSAWTN